MPLVPSPLPSDAAAVSSTPLTVCLDQAPERNHRALSTAIITGSAGLIGSEAARRFHDLGWDVFGVDNDLRATFFGPEASTQWMAESLENDLARYRHVAVDIRDVNAVTKLVRDVSNDLELVVHAAAQPSQTGLRGSLRPTSR